MVTIFIVVFFILGYIAIATEDVLKVNKSATALVLAVVLWVIYVLTAEQFVPVFNAEKFRLFIQMHDLGDLSFREQISKFVINHTLLEQVGEIAEIILYLMGAMAIVDLIDKHGGFKAINARIKTHKKIHLLWIITLTTFFLSTILDNLTTTIVIITILRKLIPVRRERLLFSGLVVIAANAGGTCSPIGDIDVLLFWIGGHMTTIPTITKLFFPALISLLAPLAVVFIYMKMKGNVHESIKKDEEVYPTITRGEKITIFAIGFGGLMFIPLFRGLTGLPPFLGIFGVLAILWVYTEIMYRNLKGMKESAKQRVSKVLSHTDMPTMLFFLGILLSIGVLRETGVLSTLASFLDDTMDNNVYLLAGFMGLVSSFMDNVALVAATIGMYPIADAAMIADAADPDFMAHFVQDGVFWQLTEFSIGVGGSIFSIGSAAGVILMGLERVSFWWYFKTISGLALIGFLAGFGVYCLQTLLF
jgi:Na+/H+ antiporter NhaD/arsenite permease-like protein